MSHVIQNIDKERENGRGKDEMSRRKIHKTGTQSALVPVHAFAVLAGIMLSIFIAGHSHSPA